MAKKPLTPEQAEIKAMKKAKKSENWTKFWAVLLAAVLTIAVVNMGKTAAEDAIAEQTGSAQTSDTSTDSTAEDDPWADSSDSSVSTDSSSTSTDSSSTSTDSSSTSTDSSSSSSSAATSATAADAVKAINDATAKAAKASYTWTRSGEFTKDVAIDPSFLTSAVDGIIKAVDENSSLNSVVGGFLGINGGTKTADVTNGKAPEEGMDEKYLLIATTLTESHVKKFQVSGNTYKVQLNDSNTPTGNGATAIEHATNDYITLSEVNTSIASVTDAISVKEDGSSSNYTSIMVTAVIENGNLVSYQLDYNFSAVLNLSIGASGSGAAKVSAKYTNFKY